MRVEVGRVFIGVTKTLVVNMSIKKATLSQVSLFCIDRGVQLPTNIVAAYFKNLPARLARPDNPPTASNRLPSLEDLSTT